MSQRAQARGSSLPRPHRQCAHAVGRSLASVWLGDDHMLEIARQLTALFPESAVTVYTRGADDQLHDVVHDLTGPASRSALSETAMAWVQTGHAYALRGRDRFANRAGNTRAVFADRAEQLEGFRDAVLRPYGTYYQLRIAVYDDERFAAFVGFLRPHRHGEFRARECQMFDVMAPCIADGFAMMRVLGKRRTTSAELGRAIDAFDEPAFLVTEQGAVVYANPAGRAGYLTLPAWLAQVPRFEVTPRSLARVARLELDGHCLWLVVPRRRRRPGPSADTSRLLAGLPPSLTRVAELLLAGLTDKEIAARADMNLATVRTYVSRLYRRLGVHSRAELIALSGGAGRPGGTSIQRGG